MRATRVPAALTALLLSAVPVVAACSAEPAAPPTSGASSSHGVRIDVTIKGDTVSPNGERVEVSVGDPVVLRITADRSGELHVHSSPEQHIAYPKGTSVHTVTIGGPGIVDVEDHDLRKVIVQLEVS